MVEGLLVTENLTKRFGGLTATAGVSLTVAAGEVHAIIGPNGAGKSTLMAQLAGELAPDSGRVLYAGNDITSLPPHQRARLGIGRSFQLSSVFPAYTAMENVSLAVQACQGHSFRFWRNAGRDARLRDPARALLARVGLADRADVTAGQLSYGERRVLEIAVALGTRPRLLLLDEPMAGLSRDDTRRLIRLLAELKGQISILLVEHDMTAVFALADTITVLALGAVIACGTPDAIRADASVISAYLGEAA